MDASSSMPSGSGFLWESSSARTVMTPELFSEEQREIARAARRFAAAEIVPRIAQIEEELSAHCFNLLLRFRQIVDLEAKVVGADMADLVEKIEWCRSHDGECAEIARAGSALAHAMSVDGEIAGAASRLEAADSHSHGVQPVA